MANETQPPAGRGGAHRNPWRGDPTKGADLIAPTAPHARPRSDDEVGEGLAATKNSGPAKFWSLRRVRIALFVASLISLTVHWYIAPWNLLPSSSGIEFKDPAGDLAIPVDLISDEPPPAPAPPPTPVEPPPAVPDKSTDPDAPATRDAGPPKKPKDAGVPLSTLDAGAEPSDAGETDASIFSDGGIAILDDAGNGTPGSQGPRDPASMFGLTKVVNTGTVNVTLGVNIELIRQHPVGGRIGPVLAAIPQWRDFISAQTALDPIKETDWILIYGPSLIHTDKDAVLVRYNASDAAMDRAVEAIAKRYDKHGTFDTGVPGVPRGTLGYADNAVRAFMRPQSHLLVIVPEPHIKEAAQVFSKQVPKGPPKDEAMRLVVKNPSNQISIRGLKFAQSLTEIRLWIVPEKADAGADIGADIYGEGDCTDEEAAIDSADKLTEVLKNQNSIAVRIATRGLLNNAKVVADGKKIKLHVRASQEQLEAVLQLVAAAVNVQVPPPPGATTISPNTPVSPPRRPNE